jgi:hypothetical protein
MAIQLQVVPRGRNVAVWFSEMAEGALSPINISHDKQTSLSTPSPQHHIYNRLTAILPSPILHGQLLSFPPTFLMTRSWSSLSTPTET